MVWLQEDEHNIKYGSNLNSPHFLFPCAYMEQTRSIELHHRKAGTPIYPHEYLDAWDKETSRESLVAHVSLPVEFVYFDTEMVL